MPGVRKSNESLAWPHYLFVLRAQTLTIIRPPLAAPDALNNLKAKLKAVFKSKKEKKAADSADTKPTETTPAATSTTPAAATEPAKTEAAAPAPASKSPSHDA